MTPRRMAHGDEGQGDIEGPDGPGTRSCCSRNHTTLPSALSRYLTGVTYFLFAHSFIHSATGTWELTCLSS